MKETMRDSILPWLNASDDVLRRIYAQLEYLVTIGSRTPATGWTPRFEDLRSLIEVAFWASLRSNEERPTRVRIALTRRDLVPSAFALATAVDYDEAQVAKLAHVVSSHGSLLVSPETDGLRIWGLTQTAPGSGIDDVTAEILAPGVVRINIRMFKPFAVFMGRSAFIVEGGPVHLPDYLGKALRKTLPADDIIALHQGWYECFALGTLAKLIVDQGHGGTILVVPDAAGDWLASIDPFAFKFSAPDNTAQEWIRQYLKENQSQGETVLRVSSSNLSDEDKMIVFLALSSRPWVPREAVQHVAPLANCDGAIVITADLRVLGFGAKITAREHAAATLCRLDPAPGPQELKPCPLEDFGGTRHQSAARFVSVHKDAVAIVVSQDRYMSVVHWSEQHNCVVAVQHAEWWG